MSREVARGDEGEDARPAFRKEIENRRLETRADMDRLERRLLIWTSSMVLVSGALGFAAGRLV